MLNDAGEVGVGWTMHHHHHHHHHRHRCLRTEVGLLCSAFLLIYIRSADDTIACKGRTYFHCPLPWQDVQRCKFFAFADEIEKGKQRQRDRFKKKEQASERLAKIKEQKLLDDQRDQERRARRKGTFGFGGGNSGGGGGGGGAAGTAAALGIPAASAESSRKLRDLRYLKGEIEQIEDGEIDNAADNDDTEKNGARDSNGAGAAAAAGDLEAGSYRSGVDAAGDDGDSVGTVYGAEASSQTDSAKKRTQQTRRQGWKCAQGPCENSLSNQESARGH